jgi:streptomycin 6-kinase
VSRGLTRPHEPVAIPATLAATVLRWNGEAGQRWLARLPALVAELAGEWSLEPGSPYVGGNCALVLRASRAGKAVVLKVSWPDMETLPEPDALRLWDGDGSVQLLAADERRGALLLERLEPGTPLSDHPNRDEALAIVCGLVRRLRRPPPPLHRFHEAADVARQAVSELRRRWTAAGEPFETALVDAAVSAAEVLLSVPSTNAPVVVNRDLHLGNVLAAEREPWLVIDPKPLVGEPAFDGGHLLADALESDATADRVEHVSVQVADGLGVSPDRLRSWAMVRAVDFAVWAYEVGEGEPGGRLTLARSLTRLAGS